MTKTRSRVDGGLIHRCRARVSEKGQRKKASRSGEDGFDLEGFQTLSAEPAVPTFNVSRLESQEDSPTLCRLSRPTPGSAEGVATFGAGTAVEISNPRLLSFITTIPFTSQRNLELETIGRDGSCEPGDHADFPDQAVASQGPFDDLFREICVIQTRETVG